MLQTTVSKKTNRRNRNQEKNKRSQKEKEKSRKNNPQPTKQRSHLRNEFEFPSKRFLGENSNKGLSGQDLRSNFHPIYQVKLSVVNALKVRRNSLQSSNTVFRRWI